MASLLDGVAGSGSGTWDDDALGAGATALPAEARAKFEKLVKRYYYQLAVGCKDPACSYRLCASCKAAPHLPPDAAAIMAVQLAVRPRAFFCPRCPSDPADVTLPPSALISPSPSRGATPPGTPGRSRRATMKAGERSGVAGRAPDLAQPTATTPQPSATDNPKRTFLYSLFSSTPLASLFGSGDLEDTPSPSLSPFARPPNPDPNPIELPPPGSFIPLTDHASIPAPSTSTAPAPTDPQAFPLQPHNPNISACSSPAVKRKSMLDLPSLASAAAVVLRGQPAGGGYLPAGGDAYSGGMGMGIGFAAGLGLVAASPAERRSCSASAAGSGGSADGGLDRAGVGSRDDIGRVVPVTAEAVREAVIEYKARCAGADRGDTTTHGATAVPSPARLPLKLIRAFFSDGTALGKSFLRTGGTPDEPLPLGGLDVVAVRELYQSVLDLDPKQVFADALNESADLALSKLEMYPRSVRVERLEGVRQVVVLLENPLLTGHSASETLLKRAVVAVAGLRTAVKLALVEWFSRYDADNLQRPVTILQTFIADNFAPSPSGSDAVVAAVRTLQLLYHANEAAPSRPLPLASFYASAVANLNFKEEYRAWRRILDARAAGATAVPGTSAAAQATRDFSWFGFPFLFDAVSKTRVLRIDAMVQMSAEFEDAFVNHALVIHAQRFFQDSASVANLEERMKPHVTPYLVLEVRREKLVADVLDQIIKKEKDLKKPLRVKFVGGGEEGMDQGGVQKEFFQVIVSKLLDPAYGLFIYEEQTRYSWPNGWSLEHQTTFELAGVVLGLALYNGVIVDVRFPLLIYKKLLGEEPTLDDIKDAFPALGKGLEQMLTWTDGDVSDVFMRNYEIDYDVWGRVKTYELVENGSNIPVTNENRKDFVARYVNHLATLSIRRQFDAFKSGFYKVCGGPALKMCRPEELELMLCGSADLNFDELEKAAGYDGFAADDQIICDFWDIVHGMSQDQKKKLLTFVTASDRVPLKGLGNLTFVIQKNGPDTDRLPTAMTCFGRLLLPHYSTKVKLESRLLTAIENAKGFGLL